MNRLRWQFLITKSRFLIGKYFLIAFGTIWLLIECPSALSSKVKTVVDKGDPWLLMAALVISVVFGIIKAFPPISFTRQFKTVQTTISLKVGDLLDQKEDIVIGSSDFFDFNYNQKTGVSLKSQMISRLFNNDINYINNQVQQSLVGLENTAAFDPTKPKGNKLRYPIGTVAVLTQGNRRIFAVVLTRLNFISGTKYTESDPLLLSQALNGLWDKIKVEGRKAKFSVPVLGAGLANVNLSHLMIIQTILLSYAIYSRSSTVSREMSIVIRPTDYNPSDFKEAILFLKSLQI